MFSLQQPQQSKQQPQPKQQPQLVQQLDQLITSQLVKNNTPLGFKLLGSSNGLYLNTLFNYKAMIYIDAVAAQDKLIFQLVLVALQQVKQQVTAGQKNQQKKMKNVFKVPLVYTGFLGIQDIQKISSITKLQISMQQAPQQQNVLAVKISTTYKSIAQPKDTLSILILDKTQLINLAQKNTANQLKPFNLLRLKCSDQYIHDFTWHPYCYLTLLTLLQSQIVQIWNLRDQDFYKPSHLIKLRNIKGYQVGLGDIKFRSFAILDDRHFVQDNQYQRINNNKYSLFLMNSIGEIYSLFPFLPLGMELVVSQYDLIFANQSVHQHRELSLLQSYLSNSDLEEIQQSNTYLITATPFPETYLHLQKWQVASNFQHPKSKSTQSSKINKQQYFYRLKVYPLTQQWMLVVQVVNRKVVGGNWIVLGLIGKQVQIGNQSENMWYRIVEVRNQSGNKDIDVHVVGSDTKANQYSLKKYQSIFYTQMNGLYRLDISSIFKFIQTNQLKHLQVQNPIPSTLLFQLPPNQNIVAMCTELSLSCIHFVRLSANKIKFQIQYLQNIKKFSQVQFITKASNDLLAKLQNLKILTKNKQLSKQQAKKNQLDIGSERLKQYQQKGVEQFKKDYTKYCEGIKNRIDQGMSKLKTSYQLMNKKLKKFNQIKTKKKELTNLLEEVQKNNEYINKLMFEERQDNHEQHSQYSQLQKNINTLNKLLQTAKSKKLNINPQAEQFMSYEIDKLFDKLKNVRISIEDTKKIKKEYENLLH